MPRFWFGQKVFISGSSFGLIIGLEWREYRFDAPYPPLPIFTDNQNPCRGWWYSVVINDSVYRYPERCLSTASDVSLDKS